jgi:ribosomal-protein-alanine N-acetyltransferase
MSVNRLVLKELTLDDASGLLTIFSDPDTMLYTDTEPIKRLEEAEGVLGFLISVKQKEQGIRWGIFRKSDDKLLGTCGYHKWDKTSRKAEIGYELGSPFWRQGYMSEIFPFLIDYGFEVMDLNRIEALVFKENEKSMGLLGKFGFQKEGMHRESYYCKGKYWDEVRFALLKKNWKF